MNYVAHYERLINRALSRILVGYKERHHIIPKCLGGENNKENIVALTAEEHYVAHQLLIRVFPEATGLVYAAVRMAKSCSGNKAYGWLRRRHAVAVSQSKRGSKLPPKTLETRKRMSDAQKGKKLSEEHKARISLATKGVPKSRDHTEKVACTKRMARLIPFPKPPAKDPTFPITWA